MNTASTSNAAAGLPLVPTDAQLLALPDKPGAHLGLLTRGDRQRMIPVRRNAFAGKARVTELEEAYLAKLRYVPRSVIELLLHRCLRSSDFIHPLRQLNGLDLAFAPLAPSLPTTTSNANSVEGSIILGIAQEGSQDAATSQNDPAVVKPSGKAAGVKRPLTEVEKERELKRKRNKFWKPTGKKRVIPQDDDMQVDSIADTPSSA